MSETTKKETTQKTTTRKKTVKASDGIEQIPAGREKKKPASVLQTDYLNEKVAINLMKDNNEYQDDVTVTYNGTNYRIKRGVTVMVPRAIKLIIDQSQRQKLAAGAYASNLSKIFEEKTERVILGAKVESGLPTT